VATNDARRRTLGDRPGLRRHCRRAGALVRASAGAAGAGTASGPWPCRSGRAANGSELDDRPCGVRYLNVNDKLADRDGRLLAGMMNERDQLHPTLQGYQVWADALKPILVELLGPPASTDLAPPATGDPSAQRK
jgi:hypothetical protein